MFECKRYKTKLKKKSIFYHLKNKSLTLSYFKRRTLKLLKKHFGNMNREEKLYLLKEIVTAKKLQY